MTHRHQSRDTVEDPDGIEQERASLIYNKLVSALEEVHSGLLDLFRHETAVTS